MLQTGELWYARFARSCGIRPQQKLGVRLTTAETQQNMLRRVVSALQYALGLRGPPPKVQEQFLAAASETHQLYDGFFRRFIRCRFGLDSAKSEAIMRQYENWKITAEFRVHVVAAHGSGVLIPVRLLDALAAELSIVPVTLELPPWAVDEERDNRSGRSYGLGFLARDPEGVLSVAENERDLMRTLAAQYPTDAPAPGAT